MAETDGNPVLPDVTFNAADVIHSPIKSSTVDSQSQSRVDETYPEGGSRAWISVTGSLCAMMCCFGLMNTIGTFQAYIASHQLNAYSASDVGWIFGLYLFIAYFSGIQTGPWFDAQGPKWLMVVGTTCLVASMMLLSVCTRWLTFLLGLHSLAPTVSFWPATDCEPRLLPILARILNTGWPWYLNDIEPCHRVHWPLLQPTSRIGLRNRKLRRFHWWDSLPVDALVSLRNCWLWMGNSSAWLHVSVSPYHCDYLNRVPFTTQTVVTTECPSRSDDVHGYYIRHYDRRYIYGRIGSVCSSQLSDFVRVSCEHTTALCLPITDHTECWFILRTVGARTSCGQDRKI